MNSGKTEKCQQPQQRDRSTSSRVVPGFCVQAYQKNTVTACPPKAAASRSRRVPAVTAFAANYNRVGFPLAAVYGGGVAKDSRRRFRWLVPAQSVDYDTYLPILVDGLRERPMPFRICAALALWDMLAQDEDGQRVMAALPRVVFPLRQVLNVGSRDWTCVVRALRTLQMLATAGKDGRVGLALVPYYRQLLQPFNVYRKVDVTSTDGLTANIVYNVADLCDETLSILENAGGSCAYANIKYVIPTYENVAPCCPPELINNSLANIVHITCHADIIGNNVRTDTANVIVS